MADLRVLLVLSLTLHTCFEVHGHKTSGNVGVCYGLIGDNLPSPKDVVSLYKQYNIQKMRIFEPYPQVLEALRGSNIELTLGVRNNDIPILASDEGAANSWFMSNVHPYMNDIHISHITVGNEVIPGEFSESILPAMQNLQNVLNSNNLGTRATTVVHSAVLGTSFPPSAATFSDSSRPFISGIIQFLSSQNSPLLVNLYPYFPYAADPENIRLDYAQFRAHEPLINDGDLSYSNLLDAMLDAFFSAMEKEGVSDVNIVISETGWPHDGNSNFTTPGLAATYNRNFIHHVHNFGGTPKRPDALLQGFIFAMFDEDLKDPGVEQKWGLFSPNMKPNYNIFS
ncbi:probable glucan endo-1,3-beta-glucosidase BG4 [Spinacia oleracea]|uniref:Probable glucan endo-1,3-beta-glucosidase BG4 n=1 Tax=Spinacia oleracea TaxID=3562 RepID=A0A9R0KCB5_SPIOL|nr:probable glucan endo-1,3-beta-glucosidase BG4 [Spinacia oleracea]